MKSKQHHTGNTSNLAQPDSLQDLGWECQIHQSRLSLPLLGRTFYPLNQMTRRQTTKTTEPEKTEVVSDVVEIPKEPVSLETQVSEEPVEAPAAPTPEKLQTDFREKLTKKTDNEDLFVPANPAALEKAAKEVAKEQGFDLNRGNSIGARLIARSQKRF